MSKNRHMFVYELEKFLRVAGVERIAIYSDGSGNLTDENGIELDTFDDTESLFAVMLGHVQTYLSAEEQIISQLRTEDNS